MDAHISAPFHTTDHGSDDEDAESQVGLQPFEQLLRSVLQVFTHLKMLLQHDATLTANHKRQLNGTFAGFCLWMEIFEDASPDAVLGTEPSLSRLVVGINISLGQCLCRWLRSIPSSQSKQSDAADDDIKDFLLWAERAEHVVTGTGSDTDSASSADDAEENTNEDLDASARCKELKSYTSSLMDLLPDLAKAITSCSLRAYREVEPEKFEEAINAVSPAAQPYAMKIYDRFPDADRAVANALAEANWHRHGLIRSWGEELSSDFALPLPAEDAKSIVPASSGFHDSGLGSSIRTPSAVPSTVYAETMVSTVSQRDGTSARVPPKPKNATYGLPFVCPVCRKLIVVKHRGEWKSHLYRDIQPYVCIHAACLKTPRIFASRDSWMHHTVSHISVQTHNQRLQSDNSGDELRRSAATMSLSQDVCSLCQGDTRFSSTKAFASHMGRHMQSVALSSLPMDLFDGSDDDGDDDDDDHSKSSKAQEQGNTILSDVELAAEDVAPRVVISCKVYQFGGIHWLDRGTGLCDVRTILENGRLKVHHEDDPFGCFLDLIVHADHSYVKEQDVMIKWTERSGDHMSLRFQSPDDCDIIYQALLKVKTPSPVRSALAADQLETQTPSRSQFAPTECVFIEPAGKHSRFFIDGQDIHHEVIATDICRYLDQSATVRPGNHRGQNGYFIVAYRGLTSAMIEDLKHDSQKLKQAGALAHSPLLAETNITPPAILSITSKDATAVDPLYHIRDQTNPREKPLHACDSCRSRKIKCEFGTKDLHHNQQACRECQRGGRPCRFSQPGAHGQVQAISSPPAQLNMPDHMSERLPAAHARRAEETLHPLENARPSSYRPGSILSREKPNYSSKDSVSQITYDHREQGVPSDSYTRINPPPHTFPGIYRTAPSAGTRNATLPNQDGKDRVMKHKCPHCDTEFTRHHNLKSHLLLHSQDKPFGCEKCDMRYRRLHDLKRHQRFHIGERPFKCNTCGRAFARGVALARHRKGPGGCAGRRENVSGGADDDDLFIDDFKDHDAEQDESNKQRPRDTAGLSPRPARWYMDQTSISSETPAVAGSPSRQITHDKSEERDGINDAPVDSPSMWSRDMVPKSSRRWYDDGDDDNDDDDSDDNDKHIDIEPATFRRPERPAKSGVEELIEIAQGKVCEIAYELLGPRCPHGWK